jgi:hypothetical protein
MERLIWYTVGRHASQYSRDCNYLSPITNRLPWDTLFFSKPVYCAIKSSLKICRIPFWHAENIRYGALLDGGELTSAPASDSTKNKRYVYGIQTQHGEPRKDRNSTTLPRIRVAQQNLFTAESLRVFEFLFLTKAIPLHTTKALRGRGGIAPSHSRPRR